MATQSVETIRTEAKRRGVPWRLVLEVCKELRAEAAAAAEHSNRVRREAWTSYTARTPWAWPFWRIGFRSRFGKRVDAADYKAVPGHDVLHQQIACQFPEFDGDDGCERLWAFLMAPYEPLPKREALLGRALELAAAAVEDRDVERATAFAFGANCVIS